MKIASPSLFFPLSFAEGRRNEVVSFRREQQFRSFPPSSRPKVMFFPPPFPFFLSLIHHAETEGRRYLFSPLHQNGRSFL